MFLSRISNAKHIRKIQPKYPQTMDFTWEYKYYSEVGAATLFRDGLAYAGIRGHLADGQGVTRFHKIQRVLNFVSDITNDIIKADELSQKSLASFLLTTSKIMRDLSNELNVYSIKDDIIHCKKTSSHIQQ